MNKLILVRGIPGSGKSTFAKKMKGFIHIETDMYWGMSGKKFDGKLLKTAHEWCLNYAKVLLPLGNNVVVSNTFTQVWEMEPYLYLGYPVEVFRMTNEYGSIHNVPESTILRMKQRFEDYKGEILIV